MQRRTILLWILYAVPGHAGRRKKLSGKQCTAIDERIRRLESRLRQGHTARQGRTLRRRVRELQLRRFRGCR